MSISLLSLIGLLAISCNSTNAQKDTSMSSEFEIAPQEFAELAKKSLGHVENFEFSEWFEMVSDDIEYYFPDGDEGTRTKVIGKKAFMDFWNSYEEKSGNTKITISKPVYIPVVAKKQLNYSKIKGVMVLAYFSSEFQYGAEKTNVRMNWGFHFNEDKKIAKIYTYYDRTPLIAAAKRNILSKK